MKWLAVTVCATIITNIGYRFFDFTPDSGFSFWPGLLVDFGIWLIVYTICDLAFSWIGKRSFK